MMAELAGNDAISAPVEQKASEKKPFLQLEGESSLWYRRFKLYKRLGPKRTLLAALQEEEKTAKVLKGTETGKNQGSASGSKQTAKTGRTSQKPAAHLTEVPTRSQVPGSWKRASIQFAWVERARAYDEWVIDRAVEQHLLEELNGLGRTGQRIGTLKLLADALCNQLNAGNDMKYEHFCLLIGRLQSVLRDIRDETQNYDESIERLLLTKEVRLLYAENKIQPKPKSKDK